MLIRCFAVALMLLTGSVAAQQPPAHPTAPRPLPSQQTVQPGPQPQSPAQNDSPQQTTATYEDWVVQCQMQTVQSQEKICDMAQVAQVQGKNIPFSRVAIAHPTKGQPLKLVVQVPVNVTFQNVRIQTSDSDPGFAAPFARCVPAGCFAEFEIKDDALRKLRTASNPGKVLFADASGRDIAIPLSFKGFSQALDALLKE
jgi:invasion protein IalB